ncbi:RIO1 family regulatory kinase/ATPase domain-containing protein [Pasteurellaceae bacterium 22721_9_1]
MNLEQYAKELQLTHPDKRTYRFEFEGKYYWLKQPEKNKGRMHFVKPFPVKAFEKEVERLTELQQQNAPIPHIYVLSRHLVVMEDCGPPVSHWLSQSAVDFGQKQQILTDSANALIQLHEQNIIHGRPYLKDILWKNGQVRFIDFEVKPSSQNLRWNKIRDTILFLYGICRDGDIAKEQIQATLHYYAANGEADIWDHAINKINQLSLFYYLLLPFKKIAGGDLRAFYSLIENIMTYNKKG